MSEEVRPAFPVTKLGGTVVEYRTACGCSKLEKIFKEKLPLTIKVEILERLPRMIPIEKFDSKATIKIRLRRFEFSHWEHHVAVYYEELE